MEKTLLWEAFVTLEKPERRELSKFVRSPFFNTKPQVIGLFDYLLGCRDRGDIPDSTAAFSAAFPTNKTYNNTQLRLATSDLLRLMEHFWIYAEKFADYERGKIRLASVYRKRNLAKHFNITLREVRAHREASVWRHAEYFHDQHQIEWEQFQFASATKRYETFNLQEISDLLDVTFIARKLRHVCIAQSHSAVVGTNYQFGLLVPILNHVEQEGLLQYPAVALYFHAVYFMADPTADQHFLDFRAILTASVDQFPADELRTLYLLALNFCIKKSNEAAGKDTQWYHQTLGLYKEALQLRLLLENGHLSRFAYNNIIGIAIRLGEVDWAEQFAHEYKPELERKFREAAFSLNLARIAYERRDYARALPLLQFADYKDLISSMNAKILHLKIYFETGEMESLESHLQSTKNYLRRQRASGYHLENYTAIIRFTRALIRLASGSTPEERQQLRAQIVAAPTLSERDWMLAQL